MGYRTIEQMHTKDGVFVDRVNRFEKFDGADSAKQRMWYFLYNCSLDANLATASCTIMDDANATYKTEEYKADIEE